MRVLLSVVGTRGDVQPVIALALEVRARGHDVHLCVPPNFVGWAQELGFTATSVGIEMRAPMKGAPAPQTPIHDLITDQFESIGAVAAACDFILGANAHQYAAPSLAGLHGIPYVNALYAATALPGEDNTRAWNERSRERVNTNRARLGLPPIEDVLRYIVTDHPLLAVDPVLSPAPSIPGMSITQTGAWFLEDPTPLPSGLEAFLDAGEPPIYFGFGSMPVAGDVSRTLIEAARSAGRRAILSQGWAELELSDDAADCLAIGDVNHQALFPRVAAVVHHGGAGTTHSAARAGVPQMIVPMYSDQPYWGSRVTALGIGASLPMMELTVKRLASALREVTGAAIAATAKTFAGRIFLDGVKVAAQNLTS